MDVVANGLPLAYMNGVGMIFLLTRNQSEEQHHVLIQDTNVANDTLIIPDGSPVGGCNILNNDELDVFMIRVLKS